jgi:UDP-GlcNAc:undecaprenyl-phosphate/decaprenyl-phosphate GlcNAc-1-phosphate transferase
MNIFANEILGTITWKLFPFFVSLILGFVLTPLFRFIASKGNIVDIPSQLKIHKRPVSYLGGLAFYFSFLITILVFRNFIEFNEKQWFQLAGILLGSTVIIILGLEDDVRSLNAYEKLSGQVIASLILCLFGFRIHNLTNPAGGAFSLDIFSIPLTIFWVILIINAVNLIDGLDGLAGGIIILSSLTLLSIASLNNNGFMIFLITSFVGGLVGFLRYNFYPATIFMGDTGSMFLGFFIASITMIGNWKKATAATLLVPIIAIGVPLFDAFVSFIRRGLKGQHPFRRDTSHIHHRLLKLGLSHRQVVLLLYAITLLFGWTAFLLVLIENQLAIIVLFLLASSIFLGIETLQFIEKKVTLLKNQEKVSKIVKITGNDVIRE